MSQTKGASDLSEFMRGRIVSQHEGCLNQRKISKNLSISLSTVNSDIVQLANEGKTSSRSLSALWRNLESCEKKCWRKSTLQGILNCNISWRETQNRCQVSSPGELLWKSCEKKTLLRPVNIKRRKDWAYDMVKRQLTFWTNIIFSGDARFALFPDSGRVWVWRLPRQEFDLKRLQPTVKHGGFSVMVWGVIWSEGRSDLVKCEGNINSAKYVSILQEGLLPTFSSIKMNKFDSLFM